MLFKTVVKRYLCLTFGLCYVLTTLAQSSKFKKVYEWTQLDFAYDSDAERKQDIQSGVFNKGKITPYDIDVYYEDQANPVFFVSIPRFQLGVPATFGTIQGYTGAVPKIKPYPNWAYNRNPELCSPERLVSVFRFQVDKCNRLWVLDDGTILSTIICPPQLIAFDLNTNTVIHRLEINTTLHGDPSILVTPVVDIRDSCEDTFVYLADCKGFSIVVYDVLRDRAWKVSDKTMYPYPDQGTYTVQGESFELMDGILGLALEPYTPGRDRKLFYHAMTSITENWVYTSRLRNESLFLSGAAHPDFFNVYQGKRGSQSASEGIDRNRVAFFGQVTETTINCWNIDLPYGGENLQVVEYNPTTLQFVSGLKVLDNPCGVEELWVFSTRLQKVIPGTYNPQEINFRLQYTTTSNAVRGTSCRRTTGHH